MPTSPWIRLAEPIPGCQYLALVSYLPLLHYRALPKFVRYTLQTRRQLKASSGLIGYAMEAKPWSLQAWTISVWEDEGFLSYFVRQAPHSKSMQSLAPHMGKTQFARWAVAAEDIPLDWAVAKAQLNPA